MKTILVLLIVFGACLSSSYAEGIITFGPKQTTMIGSIPYTVIGKYIAQFGAFKGRITLDDGSLRVRSVDLEIEVKSIKSNCPWCDRAARSRRLLNAARFPRITFKSEEILRSEGGYKVKGVLEMHGIKRRMIFPFYVRIIVDQRSRHRSLDLKGSWSINRKDFDIVWNRYLDRGGVLVGDYFTVDWGIRADFN